MLKLLLITILFIINTNIKPDTYDFCKLNIIKVLNNIMTITGNFYKKKNKYEKYHEVNLFVELNFFIPRIFNIIEDCADLIPKFNKKIQYCYTKHIFSFPKWYYDKMIKNFNDKNKSVVDRIRYIFAFISAINVSINRCIDNSPINI